MKEDNRNVSKLKWKRILEKKWFFPAVYLSVAALMLAGVLWYQNLNNQIPEATDQQTEEGLNGSTDNPLDFDQDSDPVVNPSEVVKMPIPSDAQTEIVTNFYDYDKTPEEQAQALVLYNNKYYQSKGIDIASTTEKTFPVVASLSGTVTEVREDPMLGFVVEMEHDNGVTTHYASLKDIQIESGKQLKQGEELGLAGKNNFGQSSGTHVHFEIRKDGEAVDPEQFMNQSVADIQLSDADEAEVNSNEQVEEESSIQTDEPSNQEQSETTEDRQSSRATTNT
ncbi:Stage II sporulation protein Q [Paraliobacillus sp. PM-2]|uniref:M23 family metallopeptidase n=1 Tax=Paraliobacillus sp. PM-2 TaxID=1462524 RepID=UPI00061C7758|nr:M23 family metallopeptidase [Paraliobacillus sp. PM-2]CQR46176.1 Stage II sporulation protein Q [Paraliobacillus sp. PM-2]